MEEIQQKDDNKQQSHQQQQRIQLILQRKIESITADLQPYVKKMVLSVAEKNEENAGIICDYIMAQNTEINPSPNYRKAQIHTLCYLSRRHYNTLSFKEMVRDDIVNYLDSLRKPVEKDPMHKWIGTYNQVQVRLLKFFKWLYYPEISPKSRHTPEPMKNITQLHRKEKSIYKASDLWTEEDDALFLKYCPKKRDKAYHMLSRDSSCRPAELLALKIRDVHFKQTPDRSKQYAEVVVNGKTGSRHIPLFYSVPYLKDWLSDHPQATNPNAPLIPSYDTRHRNFGRHMDRATMYRLYMQYRDEFFPMLLDNPAVPPEDKAKIRELLRKPWNPYIRRHSALTQKAKILREPILRSHAGWAPNSNMYLRYEHWFGNESSAALLEAYGVLTPEDADPYIDVLKPKACPNCSENNIPNSKFCKKCRMVLTYDAFQDTLDEQQKKDDKLASIEKQVNALTEFYNKISELKQKTPEQELEHANTLLDYKKIEDHMVKTGIIQEKDRAENTSIKGNQQG